MILSPVTSRLENAIRSRQAWIDPHHVAAFRLFNGFTEGDPDFVLDIYGRTLVIHHYAADPAPQTTRVQEAAAYVRSVLPWLRAGLVKTRYGATPEEKRGVFLFGTELDRKIKEHGVWYAIDLMLNRDSSLYLDTRNLRKWLIENMKDKSVLNTFAYTGSFGVAALSGGAAGVVQIDLNREFLALAQTSYTPNGFPRRKWHLIAADFFEQVSRMKQANALFDCVILDPPFFSTTAKGRVDQENQSANLINKVRPLINDGGYLVVVNNALFVSGNDYAKTLDVLCGDGYLKIKELIPVPEDFIGYPETQAGTSITDPSPFNHSTKIAVLEVKRKQGL